MHHLRTSKGRVEVDLVLDMGRRRVVAFEFKAGVVLYSGRHLVELADRVYGIPLCCVWT